MTADMGLAQAAPIMSRGLADVWLAQARPNYIMRVSHAMDSKEVGHAH